ncbi:hypothetical protein K6119_06835 [Paracrocinitomix mangrovi]|uniref:hypothetical protein n=1 Tax=Paracrocinitomix mangrovi TaxID=2862509 RepID=UPI001C8D6303|nr:hypothetical protein [Paracrocinitomix mangrovi]UKN03229.1 hypothetical protein K6119_06835 [Paracrocinitomix mangrovi]
MIKTALIAFSFLTSCLLYGQVYGDIFMDKRKIEKDISYTVPYSTPGKLVFDIAVDIDGKITSCVLDESKSTIKKTGVMMRAKNIIMQELKFEQGYQWPKFHRGSVQINTVQGTEQKENNQFAPPPN